MPLGSVPGAIAVPSGRSRQSSNSSTSSRSTATASLSATISARAADGGAWPSPNSLHVAHEGAGMAQWNREAICCACGASGDRRQKRLAGRDAVDSTPIERDRRRGVVAELDLERVAAFEAKLAVPAAAQRPDRGGRLARAQGERVGLGLQRQRRASLGGRAGRQRRSRPGQPPIRPSARGDQPPSVAAKMRSAMADADHFPLDMSSCRGYVRAAGKRPFFCCEPIGPCYKPAARGIAAGHDAISGRGGTGRRAGFRFQ